LMPTPSSRIASDCSKISQSMPRACSIRPVTRPPTPPPAMITFMTLSLRARFFLPACGQEKCSLPQVAENATICRRHGYEGVSRRRLRWEDVVGSADPVRTARQIGGPICGGRRPEGAGEPAREMRRVAERPGQSDFGYRTFPQPRVDEIAARRDQSLRPDDP